MTAREDALEAALGLVAAGIPVFAAPPAPGTKIGFRLPPGWQKTPADPDRIAEWQPGWALCMLCGCGIDAVDIDIYAGGNLDFAQGALGRILGKAATPSGGVHLLVPSLGVRSANGLVPGIDIKAGDREGRGRGFVFIAPTVKKSKVTGLDGTYAWAQPPVAADLSPDPAWNWLARMVEAAHQKGRVTDDTDDAARSLAGATPEAFMQQRSGSRPWDDIRGLLAREGRNNGVMRLAASLRETTSWSADEAISHMDETVWPQIDQGQGGHEFPHEEFEEVIRAVWRQYPGAGDRIIQAAQAEADLAANPLPSTALELTDAFITDRAAADLARMGFCWTKAAGWYRWNGKRWAESCEELTWNSTRSYFKWLLKTCGEAGAPQELLARLVALLAAARVKAVTSLCRSHDLIYRDAAAFDARPDLLNTPDGIVDLRTGAVFPHDPGMLLTKITSGSYRPGSSHPDWDQALTALDAPERAWLQRRMGQGITGHPPSDGIMPVLQGGGENGKSCLTTDGPVRALGDYASMASPKLITQHRPGVSEHSTEMADLHGQRLLIGEELSEGRSIDVTALKRIQDVGTIKARYVHKDNFTFAASHTLMVTTNYIPVIAETDHGTWRRLALIRFPYNFRKPGEAMQSENDRAGDPGLKHRIRLGLTGQHDAIVTWAVEGAMAWYAGGCADAPPTEQVREDTRGWRAQSDHILRFWDEFLEPAPWNGEGHPHCISGEHLYQVFSQWMTREGHQAWSVQTFASRFAGHEESQRHGVEQRRTIALSNLSWFSHSDTHQSGRQMQVWVGVKFKSGPDLRVAGLAGGPPNYYMRDHPETFVGDPASPASVTAQSQPVNPLAAPGAITESDKGTVVFDLETGSADDLFTYRPRGAFTRLAGLAGRGVVTVPELLAALDAAPGISGHNILGFDLLALAWHHGADWDSLSAKARDTELIARQADPPRSRESGSSADRYGLTEVAERLGLPGKTDDAKRLARRHGGWDKIPLDDPEYLAYLDGDLAASAAVIAAMRERYPADPYVDREHRLARLAGTMTLNGFRVDRELLDNRIAEGQGRKQDALQLLHDGWGLPLGKTVTRGRGEGKHEEFQLLDSPLGSDSGRAWLEGIWDRYGVSDPPRTGKTGKLAIGGDDLKPVAERPGCPEGLKSLISLMGIVTGTRTVYQTALDCLAPDGRVHPRVSFRQASGRWSVTNPGLTVFGKHGGRHHERDIFIPEPGHVLLSFDLSQVDMRAMAWLSGDHEYRKMFAPGRDAHAEIAAQVGLTRQQAKAVGHGWNYGLGPKRMISNGLEESAVYSFIRGMEERFPVLIRWREQIREQGKAGEILYNGFGRRMRCDPERAYTVAPALMGQGGARDIMCKSLLRLPESVWPMLRVMVHDEIVLSVPLDIAQDVAVTVKQAMTWDLAEDLPVLCDISGGQSWGVASAK